MSVLWKTPGPSSGFFDGVSLLKLPRRQCLLSFKHENDEGGWVTYELRFLEVAAFKCTYLPALTVEMVESAYDSLVDLGDTIWLAEAVTARPDMTRKTSLRHLRITFDDGPCFEFVCADFAVTEAAPS